ncbi:MAG: HAMP domain-containing sensor histidine kinase [Verrucomicrobiota bacterium]
MEAPPLAAASEFVFADQFALDQSLTRQYFDGLMRGLTHKSNNFLAVIQGFSSLILMQDNLDGTTLENAKHIKEAGDNSKVLFERILTASGCAATASQPVAMGDFLGLAKSSFEEVCRANGVTLTMNLPEALPQVMADTTKFKELLMELVSNAAEAAGASGGEVMVEVMPPGQATAADQNRVDIFVRNTGNDLSVAELQKMFEPFHTTKESHHFGIGLAVAGVLSHQMGMRLGAQSGGGVTTLWLSCPAAAG